MEKFNAKNRVIKFFSKKNDCIIRAHTEEERRYAEVLENDRTVEKYETIVRLDMEKYKHLNPLKIRKIYFETEWATDFLITNTGQTISIRELVTREYLEKISVIERLELSRRYWASTNVCDWKLVIIGGD